MKLVGKLVGVFRVAAGLTQAQLADAVGIQVETVASIEQGRRALLPDLARRLDELLDTKGALATAVENMPEVDLVPAWAEQYVTPPPAEAGGFSLCRLGFATDQPGP